MKTVAIIFLSVIGVFVACGHEALIELTPGAKKETVPSFGEQIEWLLDYEYHWKELESVRESFRFKTPEGASVERKNIVALKEPLMLNGKMMMSRLNGESDLSWSLIDEEGNDCGGVALFWTSSRIHLQRLLIILADSCPPDSTGSLNGFHEKLEEKGLWCLYRLDREKKLQFKCSMQGNLGLVFYWNENDESRKKFDEKDARELFRLLRGEAEFKSPGDRLQVALTKRNQRLKKLAIELEEKRKVQRKEKAEKDKKEQEARELEKWKKDPCYQMPQLCDEAMAYDSSRAPVELLKHGEVPDGELVIPNAHEGRITLDMVRKWGGKSFQVVEGVGHLRNGMHAVLVPGVPMEKIMERDSRVEILVAHARSRKEAMELLLKLRFYDPRNTKRDPKDVAASTVIKPGKVGDFDLGCGPVLGADGALVKGSEQSAVYFLRGNTAVMVISTDPGYPVLGMARKLDAALRGSGSMNQSD